MAVQTQSPPRPARQETAPARVNGFDTGALGGLLEELEQHPEGGRVTLFARSVWEDGTPGVSTRVAGYEVDGQLHHQDEREHVVTSDEYVEFGSTDTAISPGELLMSAVGSCITATARAYAAFKGVRLTRLEIAIESDVDLHGMFGLDPNVRPGMSEVRTRITVEGDADDEMLREIALLGYQFSPVRDSVSKGVPIRPDVVVVGS